MYDRRIESITTCKIRQFDNVFFASSGVRTGPFFNIDEIASSTLRGSESILTKVERFRNTLGHEITKLIETISPSGFSLGFQYVIAGIECGQPIVHILYLPKQSKSVEDIKWISLPRDLPSGKKTITIFLGRHETIDRFRIKHPGWEHNGFIIDRVRELISMEARAVPQLVGGPIDVLLINSNGAQWIDRSSLSKCPDLYSSDLQECP
jgi:hypothetical protein